MNSYWSQFKNYLFNVSMFRRKYIVYKELGRNKFFIKTKRLLTRSYYLDPSAPYKKPRNRSYIETYCFFGTLKEAQKYIAQHININKKNYFAVKQVYEQ